MNPPQDTPPEAQPAPVAVVVIPAAVWEEVWHTLQALREYMAIDRDTTIARLRAQDRFLGRPQTIQTRQR
jgi:sarcosine oxidase delta subunit